MSCTTALALTIIIKVKCKQIMSKFENCCEIKLQTVFILLLLPRRHTFITNIT